MTERLLRPLSRLVEPELKGSKLERPVGRASYTTWCKFSGRESLPTSANFLIHLSRVDFRELARLVGRANRHTCDGFLIHLCCVCLLLDEIERRLTAQELAECLPAALTHAEAGKLGGRGKKATTDRRGFSTESQEGIITRLKRDRPDVAERLGPAAGNPSRRREGFENLAAASGLERKS